MFLEVFTSIDLIPGAILSNKPTYRLNPQKTQEVQRQVDELLAKGLIRENLSPCVVHRFACTYEGRQHENVSE